MKHCNHAAAALHRIIAVLFALAILPVAHASFATIIPAAVKDNLGPILRSESLLKDDHLPVASQPVHLVKLIRQPGSASYHALCCPVTLEESQSLAVVAESIETKDDSVLQLSDVTVYPNPASDYLIVKNGHKANLYLFTSMGKQVYFSTVNHEDPIDITGVPCGCYTLKLELGNKFRSLQLQVRR